jgi:hypothetical protein
MLDVHHLHLATDIPKFMISNKQKNKKNKKKKERKKERKKKRKKKG